MLMAKAKKGPVKTVRKKTKAKSPREENDHGYQLGQAVEIYHSSRNRWQAGWTVAGITVHAVIVRRDNDVSSLPREYVRPA